MNSPATLTIAIQLDDEFRYLQKKKNVVKEFTETRMKVSFTGPSSIAKRPHLRLLLERCVSVGLDQIQSGSFLPHLAHVQSMLG